MKVAILKSRLSVENGGGLEKNTRRIAEAFAQKNYEVTILTTGAKEGHSQFRTHNLNTTFRRGFRHLLQYDALCQQWLKKNPQDIIFGMDRNSHQTHYRAGNGVHRAYLRSREFTDPWWKQLSFRINPLHRTILKLEKQAFEDPKLLTLFTNSNMVKDEILQDYKTPPSKICVVHNGVEWEEMQQDFDEWKERRPEIQKNHRLDLNAYHLLFVGHGFQRKGLQYLLQALAFFKGQHIQLSVVGKDKNQKFFEALARKYGIEKQVKFFGPRKDIYRFYQMADALVIPSLYDPFANVTIEALAMGLSVISSKYNGGHEILTERNGVVIEDLFQVDSFVYALQQVIKHPKTDKNAHYIRTNVKQLSLKNQLARIFHRCSEKVEC